MAFAPDASVVASVDAHTAAWHQGDVAELGATAWLARPRLALTSQGSEATADEVACIVAESRQMVIVSQTCDIVRSCSSRPYVLLAPVVSLDEQTTTEASKGMRPRFVPLAGIGPNTFADLDFVITAEKALLVDAELARGLPDEASQRRFAVGVGRVFSRFAFPDDLSYVFRGLVGRVRDKHARDSDEGRALEALEEIRLTAVPGWDADAIDVFVTFAPPTRAEAEAIMDEESWDDMVDGWIRRLEPLGVIRSVDGAMIPLDEMTAREYLDSDALDLDYLSWGSE
jgi:hypothetical protein